MQIFSINASTISADISVILLYFLTRRFQLLSALDCLRASDSNVSTSESSCLSFSISDFRMSRLSAYSVSVRKPSFKSAYIVLRTASFLAIISRIDFTLLLLSAKTAFCFFTADSRFSVSSISTNSSICLLMSSITAKSILVFLIFTSEQPVFPCSAYVGHLNVKYTLSFLLLKERWSFITLPQTAQTNFLPYKFSVFGRCEYFPLFARVLSAASVLTICTLSNRS